MRSGTAAFTALVRRGISAGIDLALALIKHDLGADVARQLGLAHTGRITSLIEWMRAQVSEPLTIERLANRAATSPRHFARAFRAETGVTPAKAVKPFRLDTARTAVESSDASFGQIAETTGFGDPGRMRRAFLRTFGLAPQALRRAACARALSSCRRHEDTSR